MLCDVISLIVVGCGMLCIFVVLLYECVVKLSFLRWCLVLGVCVWWSGMIVCFGGVMYDFIWLDVVWSCCGRIVM